MITRELHQLIQEASQQAEAKAAEISQKLNGVKVHHLVFMENNKAVIGYMREPSRSIKMACMDYMQRGMSSQAGDTILRACILQCPQCSEATDPLLLKAIDATDSSENPTLDSLYLGANVEAQSLVKLHMELAKKKQTKPEVN